MTAQVVAYNEKRVQFEQEIKYREAGSLIIRAFSYIACVDLKTGKACILEMLKKNQLPLPSGKYVEYSTGLNWNILGFFSPGSDESNWFVMTFKIGI